jgi:hypothetical protein
LGSSKEKDSSCCGVEFVEVKEEKAYREMQDDKACC